MEYKINDFEGPLDLLLHLIKKSKMDIFNINIVEITDQYLNFINEMKELNLDIASEYLVMATELMEMKSSTLLPHPPKLEEDDYEEDPQANLVNRLIEYEKYKNITNSLKEYEKERLGIHSKDPYDLTGDININKNINENFKLEDLTSAFNKILERNELNKPLNTKITSKGYSVAERSKQIKDILHQKKKIEFNELFDIMAKDYIVVTFLSILSMVKEQEIYISQDKNFDKIYLEDKE